MVKQQIRTTVKLNSFKIGALRVGK
ncbi:hypothetical protein Gogos_014962 [Gossypium gossypioides]|uniref:Uncharacterized protein n=1 Tax=Gossypium gossypioides TaxID=34282 RepID=A0A7J9C036_GOSGO|nr:hypothetical protein [Gossypium gossypioides]